MLIPSSTPMGSAASRVTETASAVRSLGTRCRAVRASRPVLVLFAAALVLAACGADPAETSGGPGQIPGMNRLPQHETDGAAGDVAVVGDVSNGAELVRTMGCTACHSPDGNSSVGPTWKGLFGTERALDDGSVVLADSNYLHESIVAPNAKVAEGFFPGIMPQDFGERLDAQQIADVVSYLESLAD